MPRSRIRWYSGRLQRHRRRDGDRAGVHNPSGRCFRSSTPPPRCRGRRASARVRNSFQPNRFLDEHVGAGRAASPAPAILVDLVGGVRIPEPSPPMVKARPHHHRQAESSATVSRFGHGETHTRLRADSPPALATMSLNRCRSSPRWMASKSAPMAFHAVLFHPACNSDRGVQRGLPTQVASRASIFVAPLGLLGDNPPTNAGVIWPL